MPGGEGLDTFFGKPGTLMQSPCAFRRRGQSGLWVSDLLPHLAGCVDDIDVHPLDGRQARPTTRPRAAPDEHRVRPGTVPRLGSWLVVRARVENRRPADLRRAARPARAAGRRGRSTGRRLPAPRRTRGWPSAPRASRSPTCSRRTTSTPRPTARPSTCWADEPRARERATAATTCSPPASAPTSWPPGCRPASPRSSTSPARAGRRGGSTASTTPRAAPSPATACSPAGCWSAACGSSSSITAGSASAPDQLGRPRGHRCRTTPSEAAIMDRPVAGLLRDLKARGLLDDTLVLWTTSSAARRSPRPTRRQGARPQPARLHLLAGRRRPEARHRLRRHRRGRLPGRRGPGHALRLPRHHPAPAGPRPQAADVLPQRHPAPPDRRPRPGDPRDPGLTPALAPRRGLRRRSPGRQEPLPVHGHVIPSGVPGVLRPRSTVLSMSAVSSATTSGLVAWRFLDSARSSARL